MGGGSDGGGASPLWTNARFVRLFLAGVVSLSGSQVGNLAVSFLVYAASRSPLAIAYVGVAVAVPLAGFALVGGTLADRHDRRRIMIASDLGRAGIWIGTAALVYFGGFQLLPILAAVAATSALTALFNPAQQSFLPSVVPKGQIASANGVIQSTYSLVGFAAFAAGGLLVATAGVVPAIAYNSLTFLGSGILLLSIRGARSPARPEIGATGGTGFLTDARAGFAYLRSQPGLLAITLSAFFANFFLVLPLFFTVVYAVQVLHAGPLLFGILLAAFAAGVAVGSPLVHRWRRVILPRAGLVWIVDTIAFAGPLLALVAFPDPYVAVAALFAFGWLEGLGTTTWLSTAQLVVPEGMQGRYFGVDSLGSFAITPVASLLGGVLIASYGVQATFAVAGFGVLAVGLALLPIRALRSFGTTVENPPAPPG